MKIRLLILFLFFCTWTAVAQDYSVERLFRKDNSTLSVYALKITNVSNDSIIVLHAQEAQFPPFINAYKWDEPKGTKQKVVLRLGKTSDDLNPEKYRATKSLAPQETVSIYFSLPAKFDNSANEVELWFSFLDKKYLNEFKKAEVSNGSDAIRKCKT
jgi:hypothetical protein